MALPLYSFIPLQFFGKKSVFYCDHCNKPSILNLQSRVAGSLTVLLFLVASVAVTLYIDVGSAERRAVLVLGALVGFILAFPVSSLMPTLVAPKNGT
jgi:hypothetical protein